ncbi:MAG: hypothetical protein JXR48_17130, partial [Candidatus Delongbacteria bacterium]|nr:hypothetical protein [Candidatus Delongbacteria bacterium]
EYIAYCRSEMLSASFFCYFKDNLFGSLALNGFSQMLQFKYEAKVNFVIEDKKVSFQDKALMDVLSGRKTVALGR